MANIALEQVDTPPRTAPPDDTLDREVLAGLLLDIARNVQPELHVTTSFAPRPDPTLRQLRTLLFGDEIELLARLSRIIEDPERFAEAVGHILPTAVARASGDERLGQVLAPTVEMAAQKSIRSDPRTLLNILYPLILPAIRKSIFEAIDQSFQSLNEALRYSLTWRGLKWRIEAWRTGRSFAEVVLNHSLVYQVEHVFLIHRHSGLLISHLSAETAASQDPQLVSSMLSAIQDFIRDSFSGVDGQELDALRLGDLVLWSKPGPAATLVAVIRGKPPEDLHRILSSVVSQIHAERHQALESFDGDSSGFTDIEAELSKCVALRQQASQPARGFPWLVTAAGVLALALIGVLVGTWGYHRWEDHRRWAEYVRELRSQPGLVVTEAGSDGAKLTVSGLRDPLAVDPQRLLEQSGIDPSRVSARWAPYQALDASIVLRRLQAVLGPPPGVNLAIEHGRIVARGSAPAAWLKRALDAAKALPPGAPEFDLSAVQNTDAGLAQRRADFLAKLRAEPGIAVTDVTEHDGILIITGLKDPLAADPSELLGQAGLNAAQVEFHWAPYQALDPEIVLRRLQASLDPPSTVSFEVQGNNVIAHGTAPALWLDRARSAARMLPAGAPEFDLSQVQTVNNAALAALRSAIQAHTIRFNQNDASPAPGQDGVLDQIGKELKEMADLAGALHVSTRVTLTGHTDAVGQETLNLSLSLARAEVVRSLLRKRGVNPDQLAVRAAGPLEPLSDEATDAARSLNRRVSFNVELEAQP